MARPVSRLAEIPVRIEPAAQGAEPCAGLGGGVAALLAELAALLAGLTDSGRPAAIDLRSLPMSPQDRGELERALGEGEVRATIQADGVSIVRETGISGVWWVEHRNARGELMAELLEVAHVPEILASSVDEVAAAARALQARLGLSHATMSARSET